MKRFSNETIKEKLIQSKEKTGYDYIIEGYEKLWDKIKVICKFHNKETLQPLKYAIEARKVACCVGNIKLTSDDIKKKFEKFIDKENIKIVGEPDGEHTRLEITCDKHNCSRNISLMALLHKTSDYACHLCSHEINNRNHRYSKEEWIERFKKVHGDLYDYTKMEDIGLHRTITCKKHGDFIQNIHNHVYLGNGCPSCVVVPTVSSYEKEICEWLDVLGFKKDIDYITSSRAFITPYEIDIYLPKLNIGIEFNGNYWHSEDKKGIKYHQDKKMYGLQKNINLIMIYEYDWNNKKEIIKKRLESILGMAEKIHARKTIMKIIPFIQAKEFCSKYHLYGWATSTFNYGLFYNDELVACMTFGKGRYTKNTTELIRYVSKGTVVGGASKLFNAFLKDHPEIPEIVSYADLNWSNGNMYEKLGFKQEKITKPNYVWAKGNIVKSRYSTQVENEDKTMKENGFLKIHGCGSIRYLYKSLDNKK